MNQPTTNTQEEWLKILGKGMVTLPKKWRDEMGLAEGDVVKAKKKGNTVVLETPQGQSAPYRILSASEIDDFLREDEIPDVLTNKVRNNLTSSSRV